MMGDGSYLMLHTELVTAIQERMKLIVVVLDNGGFQCIRGLQESCGTSSFGNELRYRSAESGQLDGDYLAVDFEANGRSLGADAFRAETPLELERALDRATSSPKSTVIHVPIDKRGSVPSFESWWDVPVAETSGQPSVQTARNDYENARRKQRYLD